MVVTHRRPDELAKSLDAVSAQSRLPDHLIVVDNDCHDPTDGCAIWLPANRSRPPTSVHGETSAAQAVSRWACCTRWHWARTGSGWPTTTAGPQDADVLATLLACAEKHGLAEVSPMVCDLDDPERLAFPLRRGLVWRRRVQRTAHRGHGHDDLLPGIASLFNGALFRAATLEAVGVPDLRLFIRGDEAEMHRRLVRSGLPFGTCLDAVYLHPQGGDEFKPILGGRMHTQYPDDATKRFFTYRNRGYLLSQPGMRKLLPQEWLRFGWFFLVSRRDPAGSAGMASAARAWADARGSEARGAA